MTRFVRTTTFGRGEVDPNLIDREDAEFYQAAVRRMSNFLPDTAGYARKLPGWASYQTTLGIGDVPAPGLGQYSHAFRTNGQEFEVRFWIGKLPAPSDPARVHIAVYRIVDGHQTFGGESIPVTAPVGTNILGLANTTAVADLEGRPLSEFIDVAQIGPSLFITSAWFLPKRVFFNVTTGDIEIETVSFYEEVIGVVTPEPGTANWTGVDTVFESQLISGDTVRFDGVNYEVNVVTNDEAFTTVEDYNGVEKALPLALLRESDRSTGSGTIDFTLGSTTVSGDSTSFTSQVDPGDTLVVLGQSVVVASVTNDTALELMVPFPGPLAFQDAAYLIVKRDAFQSDFPRYVAAYQGRLVLASPRKRPTLVYASAPNDPFLLFANAVEDDSPVNVELLSEGLDEIRWLVGSDRLYLGSSQGEYSIGEPDQPITPANFGLRRIGSTGSTTVKPAISGSRIFHVNAGGSQLFAVQFNFDVQGFVQSDLTLLAPHLFRSGIRQVVYHSPTGSDRAERLFVLTNDNQLVSCAIGTDTGTVAWSPLPLPERFTPAALFVTQRAVMLRVYDTGPGVSNTARMLVFVMNDPAWPATFTGWVAAPAVVFFGELIVRLDGGGEFAAFPDNRKTPFRVGQIVEAHSEERGYLGDFEIVSRGGFPSIVLDQSLTPEDYGDVMVGLSVPAELDLLPGAYDEQRGPMLSRRRRLVRAAISATNAPRLKLNDQLVTTPIIPGQGGLQGLLSGRYEARFLGWGNEDTLRVDASGPFPATIRSIVREYSI